MNIGIDGTWHLGGTMASLLTMAVGETDSWRNMFLLGVVGILSLLLMRRGVPESPRWLITKNRHGEAQKIIEQIEFAVQNREVTLREEGETTEMGGIPRRQEDKTTREYCVEIVRIIWFALRRHTRKFMVAFTLIFTQALFFNLVYYQYPDILANQFGLDQSQVSLYMLPLSVISFASTLIVGPFFDRVGRRKLLLLTCIESAI